MCLAFSLVFAIALYCMSGMCCGLLYGMVCMCSVVGHALCVSYCRVRLVSHVPYGMALTVCIVMHGLFVVYCVPCVAGAAFDCSYLLVFRIVCMY